MRSGTLFRIWNIFIFSLIVPGILSQTSETPEPSSTTPEEPLTSTVSINSSNTESILIEGPDNLKIKFISQTVATLEWTFKSPDLYVLKDFGIHYDSRILETNSTIANLTSLSPYTSYSFYIIARLRYFNDTSDENEILSERSNTVEFKTDVSSPSGPLNLNATCFDTGKIRVYWNQPVSYNKSIDSYIIYFRQSTQDFQKIETQANEGKNESFILDSLPGKSYYIIKVQASTNSIVAPHSVLGRFSNEVRIYLPEKNCVDDGMYYANDVYSGAKGIEISVGMIVGTVLVLVLLVVTVAGLIVWRFFFKVAYYYLDGDPPRLPVPVGYPDWENECGLDGVHGPVDLADFRSHVSQLHADSDLGFSREYEEIQNYSLHELNVTHEHSSHLDNKCKNRYLNIVAYDHSRVKLAPLIGKKRTSDYINANYIDGFQKFNAYIGTQGPLYETFEAFWRMVWEQNVYVIVMITNLIERGRRKCDQYWPKDLNNSETFGQIEVYFTKEEVMANYTVRIFKIKHLKIKRKKKALSEREIYQYHYTSWPDHGVPFHPLPVLSFIRRSSRSNPPNGGPIIVHCSAGVGRTGTYIAIDVMIQQIDAKAELNVFGFLKHIRSQRNHLVQTEEQYIFVHEALLEATQSGITELERHEVGSFMKNLLVEDIISKCSILQKQYKLITSLEPTDFHYMSARKICNITKCRDMSLVPVEHSRVSISPSPGVEGSDFINASWIHGNSKLREFILTQHPTQETKEDFWKLLWDHNAQTVVLLSPVGSEDFPIFWPEIEDEFEQECFKVRFIQTVVHEGHSTHDLIICSKHDDYELEIRIIHCPDWPALTRGFTVLKLVQDWHLEYQDGPLIVVDKFGGTDAATFCALTTLCKQLETDNAIDVYQVAKLYHNSRPGIWKSELDILHIYKVMNDLIATNKTNPLTYSLSNGNISTSTAPSNGHLERRHSISDGQCSNSSTVTVQNGNHTRCHSLPGEAPLLEY